jgi:hypothetical protein
MRPITTDINTVDKLSNNNDDDDDDDIIIIIIIIITIRDSSVA